MYHWSLLPAPKWPRNGGLNVPIFGNNTYHALNWAQGRRPINYHNILNTSCYCRKWPDIILLIWLKTALVLCNSINATVCRHYMLLFIPFRIFISSITGNKVMLNFNIFQQYLFMTLSIQPQLEVAPLPRPPPPRRCSWGPGWWAGSPRCGGCPAPPPPRRAPGGSSSASPGYAPR